MTDRKNNSNRLPGYDYSLPGAYFVTLVAYRRQALLGRMVGKEVELNEVGEIVKGEWLRTGELRPDITLDEFVVMPNHFHAIVFINEDSPGKNDVAAHRSAQLRRQPGSLGNIIAGFKSKVSQRVGESVWQRNYYDRIIRDQHELDRIREYIHYNPLMLANQNLFDG